MKKTYHGACICGQITFDVDLDLSAGTHRCNCTSCRKIRTWSAVVSPGDFRPGPKAPAEYRGRPDAIGVDCFCPACGVRMWGYGHLAELGGDFVTIPIPLIDATPDELIETPVTWLDGLNDAWDRAPAETRHL